MKCKHYRGDGYSYLLRNGQEVDLCDECELHLLADMKLQEVLENKLQRDTNVIFEKQIEKLQKEIEKLKKVKR